MSDLMSQVIARQASSSISTSPAPVTASTEQASTPRRARSPSPSPEVSKRPRRITRLSERGEMAKYQSSSSGDESSEEDTSGEGGSTAAFGDGKQEARSTFRRSQPSKIERPVSSSHLDDSSSSSDAGAPSPSPPSPSSPPDQLPAPPTPSSTAQSWAWDPNAGRLISVTRHTTTLALETLTFPAGSYLGEISPADAPRANLFLKAQRCVSGCELRKSELDRPWRMRTHFVGCEKRKADFARRGEQDVLARLFGLQLQGMASTKTRTSGGSGKLVKSLFATTSTSSTAPAPASDDGTEDMPLAEGRPRRANSRVRTEAHPPPPSAPRKRKPLFSSPPPAPSTPTRSSPSRTFIQASTGRVLRGATVSIEPKSTLQIVIHTSTSLPHPPLLHLHPPAPSESIALHFPRRLFPISTAHLSSSTSSLQSIYTYSLPALAFSNGAGLSIEVGDGKEVDVDAEVREWLSEEWAVVLLKMEGDSVKWLPVLEKV